MINEGIYLVPQVPRQPLALTWDNLRPFCYVAQPPSAADFKLRSVAFGGTGLQACVDSPSSLSPVQPCKMKAPMKRITLAIAALCLSLPAFAQDTVLEEIVARINNQIISRSELQRSREAMIQEIRQQSPQDADAKIKEREKNVLRDQIDQALLAQKGDDLGISVDTELIKRLDEIRKQMNLGSMEELEKAAEQQGVSYEDFKANMRNQLMTQRVIQQEVAPHIQISKEEVKKFYDEHQQELDRPEQVRLSEILISTEAKEGDNRTDQERFDQAKIKADEVLQKIKSSAKFEDVAKTDSNGPSAQQAGDLGFFKRGMLSKDLEDRTFAMKVGDVTDPVATKQGFVILKVTEHQQPGVPPLKDVESQIYEAIYYQKLQPALREYLTKLREEAYITVKSGYVDTGASPNQTGIITASAEHTDAKDPKRKKFLGIF
jgi:peptidyl-prolyl cis-trans isomerase SurA